MADDFPVSSLSPGPRSSGFNRQNHRQPPLIPDHELLKFIGSGSYGEVWLGKTAVGRFRAVKIVYRDHFEIERPYDREFEGLKCFEPISRLHDGLVDILQLGRNDEKGYFYYIMEAADDALVGRQIALAAYEPLTLRKNIQKRGRLPFSECLEIATALASGLSFLHDSGLVHRDIKPANIIFVNGVPKVADIGLVAQDGAKTSLGTPGFIPPEGPGTVQADIFSLGKVIYEMATDKSASEFPSLPTELYESPDHDIFTELNEVITKACDPDWRRRFQDAKALLKDLAAVPRARDIRPPLWKRVLTLKTTLFSAAAIFVITTVGIRLWPGTPSSVKSESRSSPASVDVRSSKTSTESASTPSLVKIREIHAVEVGNWSTARLGDFNGDNESDIFVSGRDQVSVFSWDGEDLRGAPWRKPNASTEILRMDMLGDLGGSGLEKIFLSCREKLHKSLHSSLQPEFFPRRSIRSRWRGDQPS